MYQTLLVVALLIEAVITNLKWVAESISGLKEEGEGFNWQRIMALVVAVLICITFEIDAFGAVGLTSTVPYLAFVLTGIIMARGANIFHDLYKSIASVSQNSASLAQFASGITEVALEQVIEEPVVSEVPVNLPRDDLPKRK